MNCINEMVWRNYLWLGFLLFNNIVVWIFLYFTTKDIIKLKKELKNDI